MNVTNEDVEEQLELLKADYDDETGFEEALKTSGITFCAYGNEDQDNLIYDYQSTEFNYEIITLKR